MIPHAPAALSPYTVLDLTEGGFEWCGKLLADLGANVIKIEPPGGGAARRRGPFVRARDGSRVSLFWEAYCVNKRGVELDIANPDGADALRALARDADILIESFAPGRMDALGLGYDRLSRENPALVYTSITPFGQTGPYAHYAAPDLVAWSMGGMTYVCGDADRAPRPRERAAKPSCTPPPKPPPERWRLSGIAKRAAKGNAWTSPCRPPSSGR